MCQEKMLSEKVLKKCINYINLKIYINSNEICSMLVKCVSVQIKVLQISLIHCNNKRED